MKLLERIVSAVAAIMLIQAAVLHAAPFLGCDAEGFGYICSNPVVDFLVNLAGLLVVFAFWTPALVFLGGFVLLILVLLGAGVYRQGALGYTRSHPIITSIDLAFLATVGYFVFELI